MGNILDLLEITPQPETTKARPRGRGRKRKAKKAKANGRKSKPKVDEVDHAAHVLAKALDADTGRRKSLRHWRKVVAEALGLKRLTQKRYDAVLARGEALELFRINAEEGTHPFLERLGEDDTPRVIYRSSDDVPPMTPRPEIPPEPPPGWEPPPRLDCGHLDFSTAEQQAAAWEAGFCCHAGQQKHPPNFRYRRGKYRTPVPPSLRRTPEKLAMGGFHGLCCNKEGLYVGGLTNDCRRVNKTAARSCTYHGPEFRRAERERAQARKKKM